MDKTPEIIHLPRLASRLTDFWPAFSTGSGGSPLAGGIGRSGGRTVDFFGMALKMRLQRGKLKRRATDRPPGHALASNL